MARLYTHLFLGNGCECPGCDAQRCDLYLTNGGRSLVRACNPLHARDAEQRQRQADEQQTRRAA